MKNTKTLGATFLSIDFFLLFLSMIFSLAFVGKPIDLYESNSFSLWTYKPFDNGEIVKKEWEGIDSGKFLYKFSIIENIGHETYVVSTVKHEEIFLLKNRIDSTYSYYFEEKFIPISKKEKEEIINMRYNETQCLKYLKIL